MFDRTITLFNYHKASGLWHTTIIKGADIGVSIASKATAVGTKNDDRLTILIPCKPNQSVTCKNGMVKNYLGAKAYNKCQNPTAFFTFNPERDFIYDGEWTEAYAYADEDYESGLYDAMNSEHDGVYMINSSAFYSLLPHFEIGGS